MKFKLRPYQEEASKKAVEFFLDEKKNWNAFEVLPTGCHAKGTKILMYDGRLKNVEDIEVGDAIMGNDSTKRTVLSLHQGCDDMYKIIPKKGDSFVVNGGHILHLYKTNEGKNYPSRKVRYDEITVSEYLGQSANYKHLHKLHRVKRLDFHDESYVFDPYFVGLYLGDGCSTNGINITTQRHEVGEYLRSFANVHGLRLRVSEKNYGTNKAKSYFFPYSYSSKVCPNPLMVTIRDLGLDGKKAGEKFIPHKYKVCSIKNRFQLLAGLLDTDAYYDVTRNCFEYCSKSRQLSEDVVFLCRSLGFFAQIGKTKVVNGECYYRIQISGDLELIPTKVGIRKGRERRQKKSVYVTGFSVEYIGKGEYYGFTLDGNHLYCDGQFLVHHNSGKSVIIADIAANLHDKVIVFSPTKEILEQNYKKYCSYGYDNASIYSASFKLKVVSDVTFATIGSVKGHPELFSDFKYIICDECHLIKPDDGMYKTFFQQVRCKVLGLTATPYRLASYQDYGSILKFLTRTKDKIFKEMIYYVQVEDMVNNGYLAKPCYYRCKPPSWNEGNLKLNTTCRDYTDKSVQQEYERVDLYGWLVSVVRRLLHPKRGGERKGILVFTKFVKEAQMLANTIPRCEMVCGDTPMKERDAIIERFKSGKTKVLVNSQVLVVGFDYPALDTVVMARPTRSLAQYYQILGRVLRPYDGKTPWFVDICGTYDMFGAVENLKIVDQNGKGKWVIMSGQKQLTNRFF